MRATDLKRSRPTRRGPEQIHEPGLVGAPGGACGMLLALQPLAGNRAVTALLAGAPAALQREPADTPTAGGAKGTQHAKTGPGSFDDYVDLLNGFQELAADAINQGGRGLGAFRLGHDLSPEHRDLLQDVRRVLAQGQSTSPEAKESAAADWPSLAAKLKTSLDEARRIGIPGNAIAAAADDIGMIGEHYLHAKTKGPPEAESPEDYADALMSIQELLDVFDRMGEASLGMGREEVQGRADARVNMATQELNAKQRGLLEAVKLGGHLTERHRVLVDKLRAAMILARTEAAGSAYQAVALWGSIASELQYVMQRAPNYVDGEVGAISARLEAFGGQLVEHYQLVHTEDIGAVLKAEPKAGEAEEEHLLAAAGDSEGAARLIESRQVEDFRHALEIIESGIVRDPDHPGQWVLTSGKTQIRLRDDEVARLRSLAATELHNYMAELAKRMAAAAMNYDSIKDGNSSFKLHVLGGWGGATDPGSQQHWRNSVIRVRDTIVYPELERGEFVKAFQMILAQKNIVEEHVKEVNDYDSDLDVGYARLGRSMQVLEVALTALVPVAGEAALATEGATFLAVGGTAVAAGTGGAVVAEGTREVVSGEGLDAGKIASAGRQGLAVGVSAMAPAATKGLGGVLGAGEAGVTGVIADTTASGVVGTGQSAIAGGSVTEGFVGGAAGSLGGRFAKGAGLEGPVGGTVGGAGAGAVASAVTGGDVVAGAVGGGVGHIGGVVAGDHPTATAKPTEEPVAGGRGVRTGATGGVGHDDAVPRPIDPASETTVALPVPSDGVPTEIGPGGDADYHGPAPSDGVPEAIPGNEPTERAPASPYEKTEKAEQPGEPGPPKSATSGPESFGEEPTETEGQPMFLGERDFEEIAIDLVPAESVMTPGRPKSGSEARTMYRNSIAESPGREAAIYRNTVTGEYIVVQGEETTAAVAPGEAPRSAGKVQRWKEILDADSHVGSWELQAHSHPSEASGVVHPSDRYPSGASGDMGAMFAEARAAGHARSSRIDYTLEDGPGHTDFGFNPGESSPYWVDVSGMPGMPRRFATMEAYHEFLENDVGVDPGPVPESMSGPQASEPVAPSAARRDRSGGDDWDDGGGDEREAGVGGRRRGRSGGEQKQDLAQVDAVATANGMDGEERREFGKFIEREKALGATGTLNERGDFTYEELQRLVGPFRQEHGTAEPTQAEGPTSPLEPDEQQSSPIDDPGRRPLTSETAFEEVMRRRSPPLGGEPWASIQADDIAVIGFEKEGSDREGQTRRVLVLRVAAGPHKGLQVRLSVAWDSESGTYEDIHEASR